MRRKRGGEYALEDLADHYATGIMSNKGMGQNNSDIRQSTAVKDVQIRNKDANISDFVLEKNIFSNVFEKDIRRVFIYKKAERLAKAIQLVAPAFASSMSLKNRIDAIAVGLVDAGTEPLGTARLALSRELLALSSVLSLAEAAGLLSVMNAELIAREAHTLLQEVAAYEEPRISLEEVPTLSSIARDVQRQEVSERVVSASLAPRREPAPMRTPTKGQTKDIQGQREGVKDRREAILSVIRSKGTASIKDISTVIRDVSEKTIQRELGALIDLGTVRKQGERRWSTYSIA